MRFIRSLTVSIAIAFAALLPVGAAHAVPMLTDSAVFSSNDLGINWNGWIWNTQGSPDNRWNLYYSSSTDPQNPSFLNSKDGSTTNINIAMTPGTHSFLVYGESVTAEMHPLQHFVLSLYFDGNQGAANISGLYGSACPSVCAASNWNGMDLFGSSGLSTPNAQESGTLSYISGGYEITLSGFSWLYNANVDEVWPRWDNSPDYSNGSGRPDFVGQLQIDVRAIAVPVPGTLALCGLGLLVFGWRQGVRQLR